MRIAGWFRRIVSSVSGDWRRAHRRASTALAVDWSEFGEATKRASAIADLSPGGAFVRTPSPKAPGAPLVMTLAMPSGPLLAHARVAWVGDGGMGVRFTRALSVAVR